MLITGIPTFLKDCLDAITRLCHFIDIEVDEPCAFRTDALRIISELALAWEIIGDAGS